MTQTTKQAKTKGTTSTITKNRDILNIISDLTRLCLSYPLMTIEIAADVKGFILVSVKYKDRWIAHIINNGVTICVTWKDGHEVQAIQHVLKDIANKYNYTYGEN